jgi:hypothetical protein
MTNVNERMREIFESARELQTGAQPDAGGTGSTSRADGHAGGERAGKRAPRPRPTKVDGADEPTTASEAARPSTRRAAGPPELLISPLPDAHGRVAVHESTAPTARSGE